MTTISIRSTGSPSIICRYDNFSLRSTSDAPPWPEPNTTILGLAKYTLDSTGLAEGAAVGLTQGGLYGQYFNGDWRSTISTGNIGTLPLSAPTLYTSISYSSRADYYGFIAIGYFIPPTTGTYTFYTSSDDGSGVWIGDIASASSGRTTSNAVVNNNLGGGQGDTKRSGTISLTAGQAYPIRIVHEEGGGGDNLTFSWAGPGITETTSLTQYFYYYGNGTNFATGGIPAVGYAAQNTLSIVYDTNGITVLPPFIATHTIKVDSARYYTPLEEKRVTIISNSNTVPFNYTALRRLEGSIKEISVARTVSSETSNIAGNAGAGGTTLTQYWY